MKDEEADEDADEEDKEDNDGEIVEGAVVEGTVGGDDGFNGSENSAIAAGAVTVMVVDNS